MRSSAVKRPRPLPVPVEVEPQDILPGMVIYYSGPVNSKLDDDLIAGMTWAGLINRDLSSIVKSSGPTSRELAFDLLNPLAYHTGRDGLKTNNLKKNTEFWLETTARRHLVKIRILYRE